MAASITSTGSGPGAAGSDPRYRRATVTLLAGLLTTAAVTLADVYSRDAIADHVHAGYPAYSADRIDTAASTYVTCLVALGVLGALGWLATLWVARRGRRWARWPAAAFWGTGAAIAVTLLTIRDTSGDTGLPAGIGWLGLVPSVVGLVAVVLLWRRPGEGSRR